MDLIAKQLASDPPDVITVRRSEQSAPISLPLSTLAVRHRSSYCFFTALEVIVSWFAALTQSIYLKNSLLEVIGICTPALALRFIP